VRRHGDNRHVLRRAVLPAADRCSGFETIRLRHLDIHEDQIEGRPGERFHCLAAIRSHLDMVPVPLQQPHRETLVHGVIFRQQNPQAARGLRALAAACRTR